MRVKNVRKMKKNLHDAMDEFIAYKKAQKLRERTVADYRKLSVHWALFCIVF